MKKVLEPPPAPPQDQAKRAAAVSAAYDLANGLPEGSRDALQRYIGWLESKPDVPEVRISENARKLFNHRHGMAIQMGDKVPFDRIFAKGIDAAIEHDAISVAYVAKVCQTEYIKSRDKSNGR